MNALLALAVIAVPSQVEPPKGFERLAPRKPLELVKVSKHAFAYGRLEIKGVDRKVWVTVAHHPVQGQSTRWRVNFDFTYNDTMDDDVYMITDAPKRFRDGRVRIAEGYWMIDGQRVKLKTEVYDQILDPTAARSQDARMFAIKVTRK